MVDILEITDETLDSKVARLIADTMLANDRQPYSFSIDHNIGAPKFLPCPLHYDFTYGKTVGIETMDRDAARQWIVQALVHGYTVSTAASDRKRRFGVAHRAAYGTGYSISRARVRAKNHQLYKNRGHNDDDDIPF